MRSFFGIVLVFGIAGVAAGVAADPVALGWVDGDFELGGATWTLASTTTVADFDEDGDMEAQMVGCGDGAWQMSRGVSKLAVPATASIAFEVEQAEITFWDFRMILLDAQDPEAYVNNAFYLDPTGTLQPDWFDDQVLIWNSWSSPLAGSVVLDPVEAAAVNIPGWDAMSADERAARLGGMAHMTLVMYGCVDSPATVDGFAWLI